MSILSSNTYSLPLPLVSIFETPYDVTVKISPTIDSPPSSSNWATISSGSAGYEPANYGGNYSATSDHFLLQLRFWIDNDRNLRCGAIYASMYNLQLTASSSYSIPLNNKDLAESPIFIGNVLSNFSDENAEKILESVVTLARGFGIEIPSHVTHRPEARFEGMVETKHSNLLSWLAYPLLREINDVAVTNNCWSQTFKYLADADGNPFTFKTMVQNKFGKITPTLLERIWSRLVVGNTYRKNTIDKDILHRFNVPISQIVSQNGIAVREYEDEFGIHTVYIGDGRIDNMFLDAASSIFKNFGFDYTYQFIALVPNDNTNNTARTDFNLDNHISFLKNYFSPHKIIKLVSDFFYDDSDPTLMIDLTSMLNTYKKPQSIPEKLKTYYPNGYRPDFKFKHLKELHDKVSRDYTIIRAEANNKAIPVDDSWLELDGAQADDLVLVIPKETKILADWGKALNICIASYGDRAARADTLLMGVEKDGKITYCIEFFVKIYQRMISSEYPIATWQAHDALPDIRDVTKTERVAIPMAELTLGSVDGFTIIPKIVQFRGFSNVVADPKDTDKVISTIARWMEKYSDLYRVKTNTKENDDLQLK